MLPDPLQQIFILHCAAGDTQSGLNDILVGTIHVNAIDFKECQHHIHADTLVAIHKGMIADEREAQPRTFSSFDG